MVSSDNLKVVCKNIFNELNGIITERVTLKLYARIGALGKVFRIKLVLKKYR